MRTVAGAILVTLLALGACGDDDDDAEPSASEDSSGATVEVTASDFAFDPTEVEATAGDVTFEVTNADSAAHTFTIDEAGVDIALDADSTGTADATLEAGTYEFRCTIHPAMTGTLTVT